MKKHKKTRQEKIIADLHRKLQLQKSEINQPQQYAFSSIRKDKQPAEEIIISSHEKTIPYPFLIGDLIKTFVLTGGILLIEILFFQALKNHLIVLPNVSF